VFTLVISHILCMVYICNFTYYFSNALGQAIFKYIYKLSLLF